MVYGLLHMGHFARAEVNLRLKFQNSCAKNSHQQALETANYLHKLANSGTPRISSSSIAVFSQQILHRAPNFSCGLFSFDLRLAFKVRVL